jgi:hypothetical protein
MALRRWEHRLPFYGVRGRVPRFYFDLDDGEIIRDKEGQDLADLNAARSYVWRALSEIVAHELHQENAPRIGVHVRNSAGERVMTAAWRGELLIDEVPECPGGKPSDKAGNCTLSPLEHAAHHAIAAQRAINEDGSTPLKHWADMLLWALGRTIARRLKAAASPQCSE